LVSSAVRHQPSIFLTPVNYHMTKDSVARSLEDRVRTRIHCGGPVSFHEWMVAALYDPECGYYSRRDLQPWGRTGDYRTSSELSPLFAATFARYFARLYQELGQPPRWTIVEAGAGAGIFAARVLGRLQQQYPRVFAATQYVIDEVSDAARGQARSQLETFADRVSFRRVANLEPLACGLVFSNELLDALPVHRVTMADGELRECYVALDGAGKFCWTTGPLSDQRLARQLDLVDARLVAEQHVEINLGLEEWLAGVAAKVATGFIVTVDYGAEASELFDPVARPKGTLRSFTRHQMTDDVLADPGGQDLTATVNWTAVRLLGERLGLATVQLERQDRFLLAAGALEELELLVSEAQSESERVRLRTGAREMILPNGMAASFQVLVQRKL
jgi:SAM-dependent MidA family methyltransferase